MMLRNVRNGLLVTSLTLWVLFAGCLGVSKASEANTPTVTPTPVQNTTAPAANASAKGSGVDNRSEAPRERVTVTSFLVVDYGPIVLKYGEGVPPANSRPATLVFGNGTSDLMIQVEVRARGSCTPCLLAKDPQGSDANATLEIKPPAGDNVSVPLDDIVAAIPVGPGPLFYVKTVDLSGSLAGAWSFQNMGVGLGVDATVYVTALVEVTRTYER